MLLLSKLLLAHLLGDFILQPKSWVEQKEIKKLKAWQLYAHVLIHWILILLFTWNVNFLVYGLIIMLSHGIIDALKLYLQKTDTRRTWFLADQVLHIVAIVIAWYLFEKPTLNVVLLDQPKFIYLVTAVTFITFPASIVIKNIISKWTPKQPAASASKLDIDSLQDAGKFIGILERLFVFTFILTNNWSSIGFLIAAKSVLRFGDLKAPNELKLTEYVLIGTLLSFGIATGTGLLYLLLTTSN